MFPLVLLAGFGPQIKWQHDTLARIARYLPLIILAAVIAGSLFFLNEQVSVGVVIWVGVAVWVIMSIIAFLFSGAGRFKIPLSYWGMSIAHVGLALFVLGVTFNGAYSEEKAVQVGKQNAVEVAGYRFMFRDVEKQAGPNYLSQVGKIEVSHPSGKIATLYPEKRTYMVQKNPMTEAAIHSTLFYDLYVSLGDRLDDGQWTLRVYYRPFMQWIWIGVLLIAIGGTVSAFDRRYRKRAS